jgi:hypothetical protein
MGRPSGWAAAATGRPAMRSPGARHCRGLTAGFAGAIEVVVREPEPGHHTIEAVNACPCRPLQYEY